MTTPLVLDSVDRFIERHVTPTAHDLEAADEYPAEIVEAMKDLGLFGATIDTAYGGLGLSAVTYARIIERISAAWMSVSGIVNSHLIMAAAVQRFGTDQQKQRFLPRFASGELRGGIALTEPNCGTDLQAVRTHAKRDGNSYVVNGTKTWITNSIEGHVLAVLVKTDPDAEPAHRGMSLLLVEKGEGITTRKLEKLGYRGIDTGEVRIEDCQVPFDNLVGGEEGRGPATDPGRPRTGAHQRRRPRRRTGPSLPRGGPGLRPGAKNLRQADLRASVGAKHARRHGDPGRGGAAADAIGGPGLRRRPALRHGGPAWPSSSPPKRRSATASRRCGIHGAYGYSKEFNIERYYRDAPLLAIGEGTNELQRIIIARQLVERNPA